MRDPNLSKETVEILASRLKDKNCLRTGASTTFYRTREKELLPYFSKEEELVYYKNIERLLLKMEVSQDCLSQNQVGDQAEQTNLFA